MTSPQRVEKVTTAQACKLELYLAGASSQSKLTTIKLQRLLDQELPGAHTLEVIDVLAHPDRADQANVLLTPALIKTGPGPVRRLVGSLDQREQVLWLVGSGQKPSRSVPWGETNDLKGQALIDLCPDGIVLVDPHGEILTSNAAGLRLLGLEGKSLDGQVLGLPLSAGMAVNLAKVSGKPIDVDVVERQWNGTPAFLITLRDLGQQVAGVEETVPSENRINELLRVNAALTKTIEETAKITDELRATRDELQRSNDEFQSFAHRVAHDIRTPLRSIDQSAAFVLEDESDRVSDDSKKLLKKIPDSVQRLNKLLDSLLAFAKVGSTQQAFVEVDLNVVMKWVTSDLSPAIKAAMGVCEINPLPKVMGDASELYQLFLNLIGNAIKYRRQNVPPIVTVTTGQAPEQPSADVNMVRVTVADNGVGFDDAEAERIFEPFTRLARKKDVEGSGIGLATAKKIVARHGGSIEAESSTGEGARFIVDLVESRGQLETTITTS